jgi:2,3-bisphosphoglycerate-independent phosphoglycerate mutase
MDRDKRWQRTQLGYDAIVHGRGKQAATAAEAIKASYDEEVSDEFVMPVVMVDTDGAPLTTVQDNDGIVYFNFRSDRARQLTQALVEPDFAGFEDPDRPKNLKMVTFMDYYDDQTPVAAFAVPEPSNGLSEIISGAGLKQFHCAETEKYAHVTYFFNGGREEPFTGEERVLVPSPKVATYDLQPEMSARGITAEVVKAIDTGDFTFVLVNFANPDMVGHTGFLDKAIAAVETVDDCVRQVVEATVSQGGVALVTADHGNSDQMMDYDTGKPHTAHTTNLVPFIYVAKQKPEWRFANGVLGNVAPTVLALLNIDRPPEMVCTSIIRS